MLGVARGLEFSRAVMREKIIFREGCCCVMVVTWLSSQLISDFVRSAVVGDSPVFDLGEI